MNWWLVAIFVVIVIFLFKFKEIKHKLGLAMVIFLFLFLISTFASLYQTNDLDLTSFDGLVMAGKIYFTWLGNSFHNLIDIGGYAIKQDWGVEVNGTQHKIPVNNTKK